MEYVRVLLEGGAVVVQVQDLNGNGGGGMLGLILLIYGDHLARGEQQTTHKPRTTEQSQGRTARNIFSTLI